MFEGWPFHLAHRGNHKNTVFSSDQDRLEYLTLLREYASRFGMAVWAYCLMGNHVHIVAIGEQRLSIAKAIGNTHRAFSSLQNRRRDVTGHLWANRFFSTALDETHLWAAVRYVELNPVRGNLVVDATDYRWSRARAHAGLTTDPLLDPNRPFPGPIDDWAGWLRLGLEDVIVKKIRENTTTGQPTGSDTFLAEMETRLGRPVRAGTPGPRRGRKRSKVC